MWDGRDVSQYGVMHLMHYMILNLLFRFDIIHLRHFGLAYSCHTEDAWWEEARHLPNFIALSLNLLNLELCNLEWMGHQPKMFLCMLGELMYAYCSLGDDHDGQQVIAFKILNLASRCYCWQKHAQQPRNTTWGDTMPCVCHGDYLLLERLAWAMFDSVLAVGPTPALTRNTAWKKIVQDIALCLIYQGKVATEHCKPQTTGSCYAQEKGSLPRQTLCSHHQGSEPQSSCSGGTAATPGRYQRMLSTGYVSRGEQAAAYTGREAGARDEYNPYEEVAPSPKTRLIPTLRHDGYAGIGLQKCHSKPETGGRLVCRV